MRQLLRLFIPLWLALCLLGCGKPKPSSYPPTMVEAARLSEHEAARALPLLEALADSLDRLDEEGRVYYDLLRLRVNDKLNVRATSDTLIRRITAFYEAYGDPDKLMLAYYYRGRVCADLNDALQAVEYAGNGNTCCSPEFIARWERFICIKIFMMRRFHAIENQMNVEACLVII